MSDADETWRNVAESAERNGLISGLVELAGRTGATASISISIEGSDRYLSISTGRAAAEPDPEAAGE